MKRLSVFTACLVLAGCGGGLDFRDGFPTAETVRLDVPAQDGKQGLKGDHSGFYDLTRGVTLGVNVGVGLTLGLVKSIASHPPTLSSGKTAVWGPHTEDLSPTTWMFTVTEVTAGTYEYKLEGKARAAPNSDFVVVLSGEHTPSVDASGAALEHYGSGSFVLDWDARATLPEAGAEVGQAEITYSRLDPSADTTIDIVFTQVKDEETGARVDAEYSYARHAQQGGWFEFGINKNIDKDPLRTRIEHLTVKSRWMATGAGRADVRATGGDLGSQEATVNECWDAKFESQFMAVSWLPLEPTLNYGVEASDCAFVSVEYASF